MPNEICKVCRNVFYVKPSKLAKGWGKYCSKACQSRSQRNGKYVECEICKKQIWKTPSDFVHSKSRKFFCTKSCQTKWRDGVYVGEKHPRWKNGINAYRSILRRHSTGILCKLCKSLDERVLAVHHLDKNRSNNRVENLTWLCHNCHFSYTSLSR